MKEFEVVPEPVEDNIRQLVAFTREQGTICFAVLNGIKLVTDPNSARNIPDYAERMIWTYETVKYPETQWIAGGKRESYTDLVPVLQGVMAKAVGHSRSLTLLYGAAALKWLINIAPVTHCEWVWTKEVTTAVVDTLGSVPEYRRWSSVSPKQAMPDAPDKQADVLVMQALKLLRVTKRKPGKLPKEWVDRANAWLKANDH
jgi:histidyl-tRNA synthetase